jgi:SNF2 family DNA or RNA helicase
MIKREVVYSKGRDVKSWSGQKRNFASIAPTLDNLQTLIQPLDLAEQIKEFGIQSSEERIYHLVKRRKLIEKNISVVDHIPTFSMIANQLKLGIVPDLPNVHLEPTEDKHKINQNCEFSPENEFKLKLKTPFQLYPHQVKVIRYAIQREHLNYHGIRGSILALEMGLGKTLISLCIIMAQYTSHQGATLVIVPKTLMTNYMLDIARFFGKTIQALIWDRSILGEHFFSFTNQTYTKNHVIICSYDTILSLAKSLGILSKGKGGNQKLSRVAQAFFDTPWHRVVCDESHRFCNAKSQLFEALSKIKPGLRQCLTGTAVRNYEDDLFAQLVFCGLNILPNKRQWTIQSYQQYNLGQAVMAMSIAESSIELPEKHMVTHYCELSAPEKEVYNFFMRQCSITMESFKNKNTNFAHLLEVFTRLRQACISPYMLDPISKHTKLTDKDITRLKPGGIMGPNHVDLETKFVKSHEWGIKSSKMIEMIKLTETVAQGEKALIFCQWIAGVYLCRDALVKKHGKDAVGIVTGETKDRDAVFGRFKVDPCMRFLVMTRVGGLGVTLTEANHVILVDQSWCDTHNLQSIGRVHRIGQRRTCFIYELVVRGSIESKMISLCEQKHNIRDILLGQGVNAEVIAEFVGDHELMS